MQDRPQSHSCIHCGTMLNILQKITNQGIQFDPNGPASLGSLPPAEYHSCVIPPDFAQSTALSSFLELGPLPADLLCFWSHAGKVKLFYEVPYGQWGTVLLDPFSSLNKTETWRNLYADDFKPGDLVIGEYLGDADFIIMRCDYSKSDWGRIVIAQPIDPRSFWPEVAFSVVEFIEKTIDSPFVKFWKKKPIGG